MRHAILCTADRARYRNGSQTGDLRRARVARCQKTKGGVKGGKEKEMKCTLRAGSTVYLEITFSRRSATSFSFRDFAADPLCRDFTKTPRRQKPSRRRTFKPLTNKRHLASVDFCDPETLPGATSR